MNGRILVVNGKIAGLVGIALALALLVPTEGSSFCESRRAFFAPSQPRPFRRRRLGKAPPGAAAAADRDDGEPRPRVPPPSAKRSGGGIPAIGTEAWNDRHRRRLPEDEDKLLRDFPTPEAKERLEDRHRRRLRRRPFETRDDDCNGRIRRAVPVAGGGDDGIFRRSKDSRPDASTIADGHRGFEVFSPRVAARRRLEGGGGTVRTVDASPLPGSSATSPGANSTAPSFLGNNSNDDDDEMPTGNETKNAPAAIIVQAPSTLLEDATVLPSNEETNAALLEEEEGGGNEEEATTEAPDHGTKIAIAAGPTMFGQETTGPLEEEEDDDDVDDDEDTTEASSDAIRSPPLFWGNGEYFATDTLQQILRADADCGQPLESSRTLADSLPVRLDDGTAAVAPPPPKLSCGSASCTGGGWPRKTPSRGSGTEVFYVLSGFGCLTDVDGTRNYFGPGDTVVVPNRWTGRWDVAQDLHRIWFVLGYEDNESIDDDAGRGDFGNHGSSGKVVRVEVIHYPELVATPRTTRHTGGGATASTAAAAAPHASENVIFREDGDGNRPGLVLSCVTGSSLSAMLSGWLPPASSSASVPTSFDIPPRTSVDALYLLEGSVLVTTAGRHREKVSAEAGDTLVLPVGWRGTCDILETAKALRVTAADPIA